MNASTHPGFVMRIPPPLMFVVTYFAGVGLQRLLPFDVGSPGLVEIAHYAGFGLIAAALLLMLSSVGIFLRARTTIIPFGAAARLVSSGPYRLTRNPMYLGLVLAYVGIAGVRGEIWPLVLLPLPVLVIHRIVIPFEEQRLLEIFGDAFRQYCARVRRWI